MKQSEVSLRSETKIKQNRRTLSPTPYNQSSAGRHAVLSLSGYPVLKVLSRLFCPDLLRLQYHCFQILAFLSVFIRIVLSCSGYLVLSLMFWMLVLSVLLCLSCSALLFLLPSSHHSVLAVPTVPNLSRIQHADVVFCQLKYFACVGKASEGSI
jgi:hypothetical protein